MQTDRSCVSRRAFVATASAGCFTLPPALAIAGTAQDASSSPDAAGLPHSFPSHDPALAREVVGKSHFDFDAVRKLVEERPTLAKVSWDWGFGDWESALGAASHVGRRDIADLLIAHGARPDIFTFAMFGQLEPLKAIIAANPGIQQLHGPHGITLLAHAKAGGEGASAVVEYLEKLGDADPAARDLPLDAQMKAAMIGTYAYQPASRGSCTISETRSGDLAFKHEPEGSARVLRHQGDGVFHPAGAPKVRIVIADGRITITDGTLTVSANRS